MQGKPLRESTTGWAAVLSAIAGLCSALGAVYGLLLPLYEAAFGRLEHFEPRWRQFPDGLWSLLMLGVGGYIGGRTVEKLARGALGGSPGAPPPVSKPQQHSKRRRNFNK